MKIILPVPNVDMSALALIRAVLKPAFLMRQVAMTRYTIPSI